MYRNLDQFVFGTFLFAHSLGQFACVPAYKWPKWPDQGPSNGAVIFYDAGFRQSSEAVGLSQVSKMLRQLTGQISAHYSSSKIRNTGHLRRFRPDQGPHTVILHTKILQVIKN